MVVSTDNNLRVAILVDDERIQQWKRNALASLVAELNVRISHVVINDQFDEASHEWATFARNAIRQIRSYPLWSLVGVARLLMPDPWYKRTVHINSIEGFANAERVSCTPQPVDEYWSTLPDETVDRIENVDVVVRFGFGMLTGRILREPRYGVLSYHPGDIRKYRGQPGGLWEFLNDEDEMGVTVQRLNETLDGGSIAALETIDISEANTWEEIRSRVYLTAENMLVPAVQTLVDATMTVEQPDQIGELYSIPEGWDVIKYVVKNTRGRIQNCVSSYILSPFDM